MPSVSPFLYCVLVPLAYLARVVHAQPATLSFDDCASGEIPAQQINISSVYGQIVTDDKLGRHLNLTLIGDAGQSVMPISNETGLEATLFTTSSVFTFDIWNNSTFFCSTLVPPSPLPPLNPNSTTYYCPFAAGPLAFSATVPLHIEYELLTITTRLRVVDTSKPAVELACVDVAVTPLVSGPVDGPEDDALYGHAVAIFWFSIALAIGYWLVVGFGRIVAAWGRGVTNSGRSVWSRVESAGFILASAISGERLASTPALMRFGTPSMRDIVFHTQWCAAVSMVAVQWPMFVYPFFVQTAWASLSFNITLTQSRSGNGIHWNPLQVQNYNPPSNFADQFADQQSPVFINTTAPNMLFMLPSNTASGLPSFAATLGLRPQDLFSICLILFLAIMLGSTVLSLAVWTVDLLVSSLLGGTDRDSQFGSHSPSYVLATPKEVFDKPDASPEEEGRSSAGHFLFRSVSLPLPAVLSRNRWRLRLRPNSFHGSILHGNLVRILILFYLPVTIFSCYEFTLSRSEASLVGKILAAFSFAIFSVIIPVTLVLRLTRTGTNKLYDETRTLMMLGPLYNHYSHGSQLFACLFFATNLIFGITIGCGQRSGTVQAIIILVIEVASALGTSTWLPWGKGASMGLISFFLCVARIAIAVLLVILTPVVSVGSQAGEWVAAAILFILGLIYAGLFLIICLKILEVILRLAGKIPFDRSRHHVDSGLLGVLGLLGCCGSRRHRRRSKARAGASTTLTSPPFTVGRQQTTPISSTYGGPPSVLRPEHALRPYREDSDDESGFIMGAWQPFPRPGYSALDDQQQVETPQRSSGFARVGGGRAHFESPYSVVGSSQPFPSLEGVQQKALPRVSTPRSFATSSLRNVEEPSNTSTVTVNHQVISGLPPGAMSPLRPTAHVRTKSQTAIIEDASTLPGTQVSGTGPTNLGSEMRNDPSLGKKDDDGEDSQEATQPKRKHWYNRLKGRRMSEGAESLPQREQPHGSFVVLRDRRPSQQLLSRMEMPKGDEATNETDNTGNDTHSPDLLPPTDPVNADVGVSGDANTSNRPAISRRSSRRLSHS